MTETNYDPYDTTYYQTPVKRAPAPESKVNEKVVNLSAKIFNPYEPAKHEEEVKRPEEFPDSIDLTKNAYDPVNIEHKNETETETDPPLLEELCISPQNIKHKLISVLTFHKIDKQILEDSDMSGPFLVIILFCLSLVLVKYSF